jgi:uncharacterized protein YneF (UPF0154 family)
MKKDILLIIIIFMIGVLSGLFVCDYVFKSEIDTIKMNEKKLLDSPTKISSGSFYNGLV